MSLVTTPTEIISDAAYNPFTEFYNRFLCKPFRLNFRINFQLSVVDLIKEQGFTCIYNRKEIYEEGTDGESWWINTDRSTLIRTVYSPEDQAAVTVYYHPGQQDGIDAFADELLKHKEVVVEKTVPHIYLIQQNGNQLTTRSYDLRPTTVDVPTHYNDDFMPIYEHIVEKLNDKELNGLVILHGDMGTGKTNLIRHLTTVVKKKILFLPSHMVELLASPQMIPFLMDNKGSVLVIEEAEKVLLSREDMMGNTAVSNVLNITDGILGDAVQVQIVATFNTKRDKIDQALLRPGRLLAQYHFKALDVPKANALLASLGDEFVTTEPMTLADIYKRDTVKKVAEAAKKRIGF